MRAIVKILLLSVVGVAAVGTPVFAADIVDYPAVYEEVPEIVPVEIGSGWYLRGDVSYDFETDYKGDYTTFDDCGGTCPPTSSTLGYDEWRLEDGMNFGVGAGYQFTDYFRGDLTAHYWNHGVEGTDYRFDCGTGCGSDDSSEITAWELLANAYVDLGTYAGFTPYIGGGLGAVHVAYDDFDSQSFNAAGDDFEPDTFAGEESWRFAYALMAGVSYDLTQSVKLDVGYRYVDVDEGEMFGENALGGVTGGDDEGFDRHTIQAGVRYSLF
ncbi:MAG: porin family protein [Rhizobiaceae bacterium]|nr:porin family protein [Rhizobiaceae bacterium]